MLEYVHNAFTYCQPVEVKVRSSMNMHKTDKVEFYAEHFLKILFLDHGIMKRMNLSLITFSFMTDGDIMMV